MSAIYYPLAGIPGQREDALVIEEYGLDEVWLYLSGQPYGGPSEGGDAKVTESQLDELARAWAWAPLDPGRLERISPNLRRLFDSLDHPAHLRVLESLLRAQQTLMRWRIDKFFGAASFVDVPDIDETYEPDELRRIYFAKDQR